MRTKKLSHDSLINRAMKKLSDYINEAEMEEGKVIDNRNYFGTSDEMMVLDELKTLAKKVALARNIADRDALYLIKKVLDKVIR